MGDKAAGKAGRLQEGSRACRTGKNHAENVSIPPLPNEFFRMVSNYYAMKSRGSGENTKSELRIEK